MQIVYFLLAVEYILLYFSLPESDSTEFTLGANKLFFDLLNL